MSYSWVDALREIGKQLRTEFADGLAKKADTTHTHDNYVTKETGKSLISDDKISEIDSKLEKTNLKAGNGITLTPDENTNDITIESTTIEGVLQQELTTNVSIGGIAANKTYPKNTPLETILRDLLVKYIKAGASITINPTTTVYKIGDSIDSLSIAASVTKNNNPITSTKFYVGDTVVNTDTSQTTTGVINYTHNIPITSNTSIKVVVNDGQSDTTSNIINIVFVNPMYVGLASGGALTELVRVKGNYTYNNITCTNDKVIFKFPESYGSLSSILDSNSFENISGFTKTTEVINNVNYNVYTSGTATLDGFSYTFKF